MKRLLILLVVLLTGGISYGQATEDLTVELSAITQVAPAQITLKWKRLTVDTPVYKIYKKAKTATSWGTPIATLTAADSTYTDAAVIVDSGYEYQVIATGSALTSTGYMYAGIKSPAMHNKGTLLLLVDSTFTDSCAVELTTLMQDMSGDGWQLIRHDVARTLPDTSVKALIAADYAAHANVKSVLLIGHVAVPYSADFNSAINPPDGHVPQHDGAWPADIYYSCLTGTWTDVTANDVTGSYSDNWNIPGDGKWDQDYITTPALLQISRVDFYNMPSFAATEVQLMRSYLDRDHVYKMDSLAMRHRAVLHDDFGYFAGEGFAANGWRNFAPIVSSDSITVVGASALIPTLAAGPYQWAYGCGGGTFTSAGGIGSTTDFASNPDNGIFTMMFGSFFGDWNAQDNFLRAPLCASIPALTNCWAGRPNWFFHHMALGENIGYSALLTQNNNGVLYNPTGFGNTWIHVALMGDLTLRNDYIKPPTSLIISAPAHAGATLSWTASPDPAVIGYYVYRADSAYGYFQLISTMLTATTYHDAMGVNGLKYYMVRPVKLQATPSGSYYNLGIGITDTATVSYIASLHLAAVTPSVSVALFPNPAASHLNVAIDADKTGTITLSIVTAAGQLMSTATKTIQQGANNYAMNIAGLAPGLYELVVKAGDNTITRKWVKD